MISIKDGKCEVSGTGAEISAEAGIVLKALGFTLKNSGFNKTKAHGLINIIVDVALEAAYSSEEF